MNSNPSDKHESADTSTSLDATTQSSSASDESWDDLTSRPGYLIRRLHQIHIGLFDQECGEFEITPIQYGLLTVLSLSNALDQVTLSTAVGIDRTSGADVIKRLQRRGLLTRLTSEKDRRAKLVQITDEGRQLVERMHPSMEQAQRRLVEPLTLTEKTLFTQLMQKVIQANNTASRAPMNIDFPVS